MAESNNQLVRALGLTDSSALVVGKVIGTGVFLKAAVMTQQVHTPLLMLAAWVAAGLLSLAGTLAYAELAAMFPQAGGEYVYLRAAYGKAPAFLYGWMQIVVGQAGVIAALGIACATFASALLPLNAVWFHHTFHLFSREVAWRFGLQQIVALALILSFAAINCAGVALGGRAQSVLTWAKLLGIGLIVVGAFFFSGNGSWSNLTPASEGSHWSGFGPFGAAMLAALWAYNGWANLPMAAGEVRDPGRNMPRALIGGMLVVIAVYVLVNLAYVYALPLVEVLTSNSTAYSDALPVATKAARTFVGSAGEKFISVAFVISGLGSLNAGILTAARVPFAMSCDGLFFSRAASLGRRSRAPVWAIIIQSGWACVSGAFWNLRPVDGSCGVFAVDVLWFNRGGGVRIASKDARRRAAVSDDGLPDLTGHLRSVRCLVGDQYVVYKPLGFLCRIASDITRPAVLSVFQPRIYTNGHEQEQWERERVRPVGDSYREGRCRSVGLTAC